MLTNTQYWPSVNLKSCKFARHFAVSATHEAPSSLTRRRTGCRIEEYAASGLETCGVPQYAGANDLLWSLRLGLLDLYNMQQ